MSARAIPSSTVVAKQTTFLECEDVSGGRYRVHFRGKRNFSLEASRFSSAEILRDHPLLIDFREPKQDIHLSSRVTPAIKDKLVERICELTSRYYSGWNRFSDDRSLLFNVPDLVLTSGWGVLFHGPIGLVKQVEDSLRDEKISFSTLDSWTPPESSLSVLLLDGKDFVVAETFEIEKLGA